MNKQSWQKGGTKKRHWNTLIKASFCSRGYGIRHGEKFVLRKKQIKYLMGEFDQIRKNLCTALDKGGVVVVASDGVLITAYDFDSRKGNY